jgi:hypothetical protein
MVQPAVDARETALVITSEAVAITNGVVWKVAPFGQQEITGRLRLAVIVDKRMPRMKKYTWLFAGITALILTTVIVLSVSARSKGGVVCIEDGSCCVDPDACTCE